MDHPKRKTAREQAFELIRNGMDTLFRCSDEPRAVAIAVVWRNHDPGSPAGTLMGPDGEPLGARELTQLLEQLARMSGFVAEQIRQLATNELKRRDHESPATGGGCQPEASPERGPEAAAAG